MDVYDYVKCDKGMYVFKKRDNITFTKVDPCKYMYGCNADHPRAEKKEYGYYCRPRQIEAEVTFSMPSTHKCWVTDSNGLNPRLADIFDGSHLDTDFNYCELLPFDGIITLDNGKFLIKKHGKYMPNLSFISDIPYLDWQSIDATALNLANGKFDCLRGDYFVSKKGTKCFAVKDNGKHLLLRDDWGGAFNSSRGHNLTEGLYLRRASSNGGGSGYDYAVVPYGWRHKVSVDDI